MLSKREWERRIVEMAQAEGLRDIELTYTAGNHIQLRANRHVKGGRIVQVLVTTGSNRSSGDARAIRNIRRDIRQAVRMAGVFVA